VFVASDQHSIIEQLRSIRSHWTFVQLNVHTLLEKQWPTGHVQEQFNRLSIDEKYASTMILLTEIECLVRINYVICTFSSNICRLIQILRTQSIDSVVSLDQNWYPQ
jgi:hypothetical protein